MVELPDFWRTETIHPLIVHFPVALLPIATLFAIFAHFTSNRTLARSFATPTLVMLFIGVGMAWLAVYTGHLADGIVSRKICDPTVLKDHENLSIASAGVFTAGLIAYGMSFLAGGLRRKSRIALLSVAILVSGTGLLAYSGHLGATLVYQQAAGVYTPTSACLEFSP